MLYMLFNFHSEKYDDVCSDFGLLSFRHNQKELNEPICLENASEVTHEFLNGIFSKKKLIKVFLLKCNKKTHVSILMHFLDKMAHLFSLKIEALRSESVQC